MIAEYLLKNMSGFQDYRKQRQSEAAAQGSTNSTSKIDSMARILFPMSFFMFNVIYWYSYFSAHPPFEWHDHMLKGEYTKPWYISDLVWLMRAGL